MESEADDLGKLGPRNRCNSNGAALGPQVVAHATSDELHTESIDVLPPHGAATSRSNSWGGFGGGVTLQVQLALANGAAALISIRHF
jgi:hypothetical protein